MAVGLAIIAAGFAILSTATPATPYPVIAVAFAVLGAGMGSTAAPATGEIMSAVPMSKAGVGSAVNDTTRELGGALGIAVLGSIANSAYRASIDLGGLRLGASARGAAEESIGAAAQVASGGAVRERAADAFAHAFHLTSLVSISVVLAAAIGVLLFSSRGDGDRGEEVEGSFDLDLAIAGAGEGTD